MTITVIICTRNRGALIEATLRSVLAGSCLPDEILVVDQSDGDQTRHVVEEIIRQVPALRYLATSTRGLSQARNVGLEQSRGEVIVFTDDDVIVCPDWLGQILSEFTAYPRLALLFGTVLPPEDYNWRTEFVPYCRLTTHRPVHWFEKEAFAGMGANMSLRRTTFERVGGFDPAVGPGNETTGDDYEYALRCLCHQPPLEMHLLDAAQVIHHAGARKGEEYYRFVHQMNGTGMGLFWAYLTFGRRGPRYAMRGLLGLAQPMAGFIRELAQGRKPSGLRTYAYCLRGFLRGLRSTIFRA